MNSNGCYIIKMIRKAGFSGQFYPSDPGDIVKFIDGFAQEKTPDKLISAKGLVLPHAGYIYSGRVAVMTVAKVKPRPKVIILGPNHTGRGKQFSLYPEGKWLIPGAEVNIDRELADKILSSGTTLSADFNAHAFEHSIEVQLPILKHFFDDFTLIPIVCGEGSFSDYERAAGQIFKGIQGLEDQALIIASGDMTHYEQDSLARKKDSKVIEKIINLDVKGLCDVAANERVSMCGTATVPIMLIISKLMGADKGRVIIYQTSGDVTGDYESVVGYLGAVIT